MNLPHIGVVVYSINTACDSETPCQDNQICYLGQCYQTCSETVNPCENGLVCTYSGVCGYPCDSAVNCPGGTICVDGQCVLPVSNLYNEKSFCIFLPLLLTQAINF